jgi:hypothetical protein
MATFTLRRLSLAAGAALLTVSPLSFAHYPFCNCALKGEEIICEAGFSDGSSASGVSVDLISYDEEIITAQAFNEQSTARFTPFDGEFYILLDAGPGHTVEVDWHDIEGLKR